jgi:hypothetical protein
MRLPQMSTRRWMIVMAIAALWAWAVNREGFRTLVWGAPLLGSFLGIVLAGGGPMRLPRMSTRRWMIVVAIVALGAWRVKQERFLALFWGITLLGSFLGIVVAGGSRRRLLGSVLGAAIASACVWFANFFVYQKYTFVTVFQAPREPFTEAMAGAILGSFVGLVVGIAASLDYRRSMSWLWWRRP